MGTLSRRSFLAGTGAILLAQSLAGCTRPDPGLRVQLLEGSIPVQLLQSFRRQVGDRSPAFGLTPQLADLFKLLQTWQQPPADDRSGLPFVSAAAAPNVADVASLGDFWLSAAIRQKLIQPLDLAEIEGWADLAPAWKRLVQRDRQGNLSETGELWAAPYRWGTLMIAYRPEELGQQGKLPIDWADLWQPALKGKLSLPDSPRSVIGLTLKKLGQSLNASSLSPVTNLTRDLQALNAQTRFYSSTSYLQPLTLGDTWAAVGWSNEILPLLKRNRELAAVIPASGTALTADLWVQPATARLNPDRSALLKQWLSFCWEPAIANQISLLSAAASPVLVNRDRTTLPAGLKDNPLRLPPTDLFQRSEFLLPLPEAAMAEYRQVWTAIRQTVPRR